MEFPFMHVGACEPVFIFPTYLSCLDEQHVISFARRVLALFLLVCDKRPLSLILPWKHYNSALCWGMSQCCQSSDHCNLRTQRRSTPPCDLD